jgi:molecular chaperone DnaJ
MSKEWHPDKHKGDKNAEKKFAEINEAYEVLSNPEKRKKYDQFGSADGPGAGGFSGGGGFDFSGFQQGFGDAGDLGDLFGSFFGGGGGGGRKRSTRGEDVSIALDISLREAFAGAERTLTLRIHVACGTCRASGVAEGSRMKQCATCSGSGQVTRTVRSVFGLIQQRVPCETCAGAGEMPEKPCKKCGGEGRLRGEQTVTVRIPPGIHSGQALRLRGKGAAGFRGDEAGDLEIAITVLPDTHLTRDGDDIRSSLDVSVPDAALGATLDVDTLHGSVTFKIPEGTQPGDVLRVKGKGMPVLNTSRFGDQYVTVNVVIPKKLSKAERKLMEEWRKM